MITMETSLSIANSRKRKVETTGNNNAGTQRKINKKSVGLSGQKRTSFVSSGIISSSADAGLNNNNNATIVITDGDGVGDEAHETGDVADEVVNPNLLKIHRKESQTVHQQKQYSKEDKDDTLLLLDSMEKKFTDLSRTEVISLTSEMVGVCPRTITRWLKPSVVDRRRTVDDDFDKAVKSRLFLDRVIDLQGKHRDNLTVIEKRERVSNTVFSYALAKKAALEVQSSPQFANNPIIKNLTFSNPWLHDFLKRVNTTKVTISNRHSFQERASVQEIDNFFLDFIECIEDNSVQPRFIANFDETSVFQGDAFGIKCISVPHNGVAIDTADMKKRITVNLGACGDGNMPPSYFIIKSPINMADLSGSTVLKMLMEEMEHPEEWIHGIWVRKLDVFDKKSKTTVHVEFKRPYLKHMTDKTIITIQHKALMDSIGILMWAELCLVPYWQELDEHANFKKVLIWDSCALHKCNWTLDYLAKHNILVKFLPKNMTDILQIIDLVVIGPFRKFLTYLRGDPVYNQFQSYLAIVDAAMLHSQPIPVWELPEMSEIESINSVREFIRVKNNDIIWRDNMVQAFMKLNMYPKSLNTIEALNRKHVFSASIASAFGYSSLSDEDQLERHSTMIPLEISSDVATETRDNDNVNDIDDEYSIVDSSLIATFEYGYATEQSALTVARINEIITRNEVPILSDAEIDSIQIGKDLKLQLVIRQVAKEKYSSIRAVDILKSILKETEAARRLHKARVDNSFIDTDAGDVFANDTAVDDDEGGANTNTACSDGKTYDSKEDIAKLSKNKLIELCNERGFNFDKNCKLTLKELRMKLSEVNTPAPTAETTNTIPSAPVAEPTAAAQVWCICETEVIPHSSDESPIVKCCTGEKCKLKWFHFKCLEKPVKWKAPTNWKCARCNALGY